MSAACSTSVWLDSSGGLGEGAWRGLPRFSVVAAVLASDTFASPAASPGLAAPRFGSGLGAGVSWLRAAASRRPATCRLTATGWIARGPGRVGTAADQPDQ